jgi:hypothetical protein
MMRDYKNTDRTSFAEFIKKRHYTNTRLRISRGTNRGTLDSLEDVSKILEFEIPVALPDKRNFHDFFDECKSLWI